MSSLNKTLANHSICKLYHSLRKDIILESFSSWVKESSFNDWHLSLSKFSTIRPLKYYDPQIINKLLTFFEENINVTFDALSKLSIEITHAITSLLREGSSWNYEKQILLDNPKDMLDFERIWHPEYQRYCEHIFNHFICIPLYILGKLKNKDYLSPNLSNRCDILQNNGLGSTIKGYRSIVRNAISHGHSFFDHLGINYIDRNNKTLNLSASEFSRLFDELVNSCHSFVISILLFLCNNQDQVINNVLRKLPLGIRLLFISAFSSHRGFEVMTMIESQAIGNRKQLNIHCKSDTLYRDSHLFESLHVAWHSLKCGGDDYDRIGIVIDCKKSVSPAIFINADKLREAIINDRPIDDRSGIIETSLLWLDTSNIRFKKYLWGNIAYAIWQSYKRQVVEKWREIGLKVLSSRYEIRYIENKSTDKLARIEAHIIIKGPMELDLRLQDNGTIRCEMFESIVKHVMKKLKRRRIKLSELDKKYFFKRTPKYIWLSVYLRDARIRNLLSSGWQGKNLFAKAEWFSRWSNYGPIMLKHKHSILKRISIEYNPEIIKEHCEKQGVPFSDL